MHRSWSQKKLACGLLVILLACFLFVPSVEAGQKLCWRDTTWRLGPGFGDPWNKYAWAMADFKRALYVGTNNVHFDIINALADPNFTACIAAVDFDTNPFGVFQCFITWGYEDSDWPEVWRYDYKMQVWQMVHTEESGGYRKMKKWGGWLYASQSTATGARLLYTRNGYDWQTLANPLSAQFGYIPSWSFRALEVYRGKLYVGTDPGQLWRYSKRTGWEFVHQFLGSVTELAACKGKLYVGTMEDHGGIGFGVYEMDRKGNVTDITPQQVDGTSLVGLGNMGVSKLYASRSILYVGTANFTDQGFAFLRYDCRRGTWYGITLNGFFHPRNTYVWSMARFKGKLYMGTFTSDFLTDLDLDFSDAADLVNIKGSAQLWRSTDGWIWFRVALPMLGFGVWDYGFRNMEVGNRGKTLFLGTASNLFAPDADELIAYLLSLFPVASLPSDFADVLEGMDVNAVANGFFDSILHRLFGPGTEIWAIEKCSPYNYDYVWP